MSVKRDRNSGNKKRKLRWDGFKMAVTATLPELSESTLQTVVLIFDTQYPLPFSRQSVLFLHELL